MPVTFGSDGDTGAGDQSTMQRQMDLVFHRLLKHSAVVVLAVLGCSVNPASAETIRGPTPFRLRSVAKRLRHFTTGVSRSPRLRSRWR